MPKSFKPEWRSPPGDTIYDLMEERKIGLATLSEHLGHSIYWTFRLLQGTEHINEEIASKLEKLFNVRASFWLSRERMYRKSKHENDS